VKPKVYIETTVVSYLTSRPSRDLVVAAHQQITRDWWDRRRKAYEPFVSEFVVKEASAGDPEAAAGRLEAIRGVAVLQLSPAVDAVARDLVAKGVIPAEYVEDAVHIAVAAANGMDFLVTWNCSHIANARLRGPIERIVGEHGFACPVICTPTEMMEDEP